MFHYYFYYISDIAKKNICQVKSRMSICLCPNQEVITIKNIFLFFFSKEIKSYEFSLRLKTESQNEVRKLRNGRHHKLLTDTIVLAKLVPIHVKKVLVLSCSTTIPFVLNNSPRFHS